MKIKFDSNQAYQREAIDAVLELFKGQPLGFGLFEFPLLTEGSLVGLNELGFANELKINEVSQLANLHEVQRRQRLPLIQNDDFIQHGNNFSVEMETGTGKTYVYLRTIFELHQRYGFAKFIVVVPSVAIREGVISSIKLMKDHFRSLFGNIAFDTWTYDARQYSKLRQFAQSNSLQILVINIDAFNKESNNVIHQDKDQLSGRKPIEFVQAARPIVVMDEPQNMETEQAKKAISSLNPLCTLRYSATHRKTYNLVYRLDPVKAYDLKLVKRIEVNSILDDPDYNQPFIRVQAISATKTKVTAKLSIDVNGKNGPERKSIQISEGNVDLFDRSNQRSTYAGHIIDEINARDGFVSFTNGLLLKVGQTYGGRSDDVMRVQIRETVKEHFEKELRIRRVLPAIVGEEVRLKVLSLFFIDRVANYANQDGKIRRWFTEAYTELAAQPRYRELSPFPVDEVHGGYFASYKGLPKDTRGDSAADDDAYALIMQEKERLLSPDVPLRFIFSHSALREGWDNPNVFQICTLNETKSELKKRQEIGRGLRLPVLDNGERCFDTDINRLTLVANEHYDEFARQLQQEIEEDCGIKFDGRIINQRESRTARIRPGWQFNPDFKSLWERIKHKTKYAVEYSTGDLIEGAARVLASREKVRPPKITIQKSDVRITSHGLDTILLSVREEPGRNGSKPRVPDLIGYLQAQTELTRRTIAEILIRCGRLDEVTENPQQFLEQAQESIEAELRNLMIDGIKYERINGQEYEMMLFEEREITGSLVNMINVENSIFDTVLVESEIEREFAETMSAREDIRLFIKLPEWFKIPTPVGTFNPDWAIVKQEEERVYLVRETKATKDQLRLRASEWAKIQCGKSHFETLDVDFDHVSSATEV
jgi:type III restriction enzyme